MTFYTPNNFKGGRLIFNRYRYQDLLIFATTLSFSLLAIIIAITQFEIYNIIVICILVFPALIGFFLVQPLGVYHNFLMYGLCAYNYLKTPKNYIWEGIYKYEVKKE